MIKHNKKEEERENRSEFTHEMHPKHCQSFKTDMMRYHKVRGREINEI